MLLRKFTLLLDQFHGLSLHENSDWRHGFTAAWQSGGAAGATHVQISWISAWIPSEVTRTFFFRSSHMGPNSSSFSCRSFSSQREPTVVSSIIVNLWRNSAAQLSEITWPRDALRRNGITTVRLVSGDIQGSVSKIILPGYRCLGWYDIDGLVQERRNSSALVMELPLYCINPSIWSWGRLIFHTIYNGNSYSGSFIDWLFTPNGYCRSCVCPSVLTVPPSVNLILSVHNFSQIWARITKFYQTFILRYS